MFQSESQGRIKATVPAERQEKVSYLGEGQPFCSIQALKGLAEALPHWGGVGGAAPCFTHVPIEMFVSSRDANTPHPGECLGTLFTPEINHHKTMPILTKPWKTLVFSMFFELRRKKK